MPPPSLHQRLLRATLLWALPTFLISTMVLIWFYRSSTYRIFDDSLQQTLHALIAALEIDETENTPLKLRQRPAEPSFTRALSGHYWWIGRLDDNQNMVTLEASLSLAGEALEVSMSPTETITHGYIHRPDETLRFVARRLLWPPSDRPVMIVSASDNQPIQAEVHRFILIALTIMGLICLGLIGAVLAQIKLGLRPLSKLQKDITRLRNAQANRLNGIYPPDIQPLADELNQLITYNREIVERARTHVSNLAHGLKTPLAILRNEAETKDSDLAGFVTTQTAIMQKQINHHLRRAQAAARGQTLGQKTHVKDTLEGLKKTLLKIYKDKPLTIDISCSPDLIFLGERRDLEEILGNLLDNGCKWAHKTIQVQAHMSQTHIKQMTLSIEDDGNGLCPQDYEQALQRGTRLDENLPGTGFGLAIVEDLSRAYKGTIHLSRADQGGLKITLVLPATLQQTDE